MKECHLCVDPTNGCEKKNQAQMDTLSNVAHQPARSFDFRIIILLNWFLSSAHSLLLWLWNVMLLKSRIR